MKVLGEPGVLARSERFFSTPGAVARSLFYYVTRAGHYYYDENYDFRDNCEIAHLESHRNFYLLYVRAGTMCVHTDHEFSVERGQAALVDCRKPHRFFTKGDAEAIWIHFDGANAAAFFAQIVAFNGGRQTFSPPAPLHLEQELAQLVLGLRTGEMSEVERSQALYRILCGLLLPQSTRGQRENDAVASAVRFIDSRLTEELPVRCLAFLPAVPRRDRLFAPRVHHAPPHRRGEGAAALDRAFGQRNRLPGRLPQRGKLHHGLPLENRPVPHPVSE